MDTMFGAARPAPGLPTSRRPVPAPGRAPPHPLGPPPFPLRSPLWCGSPHLVSRVCGRLACGGRSSGGHLLRGAPPSPPTCGARASAFLPHHRPRVGASARLRYTRLRARGGSAVHRGGRRPRAQDAPRRKRSRCSICAPAGLRSRRRAARRPRTRASGGSASRVRGTVRRSYACFMAA